jgi:rare lipoprotein A
MPSYVRVTNLANNRSIVVRVNDRGPYAANRVIDVSVKAAQLLGFHDRGLAKVRVEYVGRAPLEGSDDRQLIATLREGEAAPAPSAVRIASAKPFLPEAAPEAASQKATAVPPPDKAPPLTEISAQASLQTRDGPETAIVGRKPRVEAMALPPMRAALEPAYSQGVSGVSAFAPTRYDAPAAFLSGRGLY